MEDFDTCFFSLLQYPPFRWQRRLYKQILAGDIPRYLDLPTGVGKTSIIPIWLIALATQCEAGPPSLPRRLVYIVNRRTVVDQATNTALAVRRCLIADDPEPAVMAMRKALYARIASRESPLAVSTLRGELADNKEWILDPTRPAIIIGTIDMIGSKLLFNGYGDSRYWKPHHAGLIGQDSLIVHDESHLTPTFDVLLQDVMRFQQQGTDPRPIRVLSLSATLADSGAGERFCLTPEDDQDCLIRDRLTAMKTLQLEPDLVESKDLPQRAAELAVKTYEPKAVKVLIYLHSPEGVGQAVKHLRKQLGLAAAERIGLLSGTTRGLEREQAFQKSPVFRAFMSDQPVTKTTYLVSTSAGEVGIDLLADHLICDVVPLDALIQRLGRVNRRGGPGREANVHIIVEKLKKQPKAGTYDAAVDETAKLLQRWSTVTGKVIVSPRSLQQLLAGMSEDEWALVRSPSPGIVPISDIILDTWTLTSLGSRLPGHLEPSTFLHGIAPDLPHTEVAWRAEVPHLAKGDLNDDDLKKWFRFLPLRAHERLSDRSERVQKALIALLKAHRKQSSNDADFPVILLDERGNAEKSFLSTVLSQDIKELYYRTLVMPPSAGGLAAEGVLSDSTDPAPDVAEQSGLAVAVCGRWLHTKTADEDTYVRLADDQESAIGWSDQGVVLKIPLQAQGDTMEDSDVQKELILTMPPKAAAGVDPELAPLGQDLKKHCDLAADWIEQFARHLQLNIVDRNTLIAAARMHDAGKQRPVWQRYAKNPDGAIPVAKSPQYLSPQALAGYRHEFGSLVDAFRAKQQDDLSKLDLLFHLIACHHGWARPHFPLRAFDPAPTSTKENEMVWRETLTRFERLQMKLGRWGLAWYESIMRSADMAASGALDSQWMSTAIEEGGCIA